MSRLPNNMRAASFINHLHKKTLFKILINGNRLFSAASDKNDWFELCRSGISLNLTLCTTYNGDSADVFPHILFSFYLWGRTTVKTKFSKKIWQSYFISMIVTPTDTGSLWYLLNENTINHKTHYNYHFRIISYLLLTSQTVL